MKLSPVTGYLKGIPILSQVALHRLEWASQRCSVERKKRGTILYQKDDAARYMYFLQTGFLMETVYFHDSVDIIVKVKRPGDYFGETAIMTGSPYLNAAIVMENATLIVMPKDVFLTLAQEEYSICQMVITQLVDRLNNSAQNMVNSMYLDAPGRLAFTIINLLPEGERTPRGRPSSELRVTQSALAASSGMARQTAAKILGDWRKEGWISTERGKFSVLQIEPLLEIMFHSEMRC